MARSQQSRIGRGRAGDIIQDTNGGGAHVDWARLSVVIKFTYLMNERICFIVSPSAVPCVRGEAR